MMGAASSPTSNFPTTFFTDERLAEMWAYVRYFLAYVQKPVMIIVALITAGMLAVLIVGIPAMAKDKQQDDDDDEFDYY
ncbi:hypothetical protein KIH86_04295 [Paenibacillus sp. HN-1]|uniref:hypothetical protein n=1 Tax=Paenibacillus sp. CGMCC 1.18879 TaxID=2834466 RepID=UPI001CA7CAE4|nr:hypothetical protein [Paenibacillus sp. CGMCC 1.18879]MBY9082615.1 hypothetical protein [Paenibacillus sp. CGMCC 1.18879]MBY9083448.1 hypothetical protein [Paenibacillus sinensis]